MSDDDAKRLVKEFFKENPEALELLIPQEDGHLFSKGLRDAMEPFEKMDVKDCIHSPHFLRALCKHAGMSDEKFDEILEGDE